MLAKISEYGMSMTQGGAPQFVVKFDTKEAGTFVWYGSLKEKSRPFTIKALMKMGWTGSKVEDMAPIALGIPGGALNHAQEYDIVVSEKADQDGKIRKRVDWINLPGESAIKGKMEQTDAAAALLALAGLNGDILAIKKDLPPAPDNSDVPF